MTGARRAFVLGGGVAGLAAAFALADRGLRVTLLESRRRCGGRAFSSDDRVLGRPLDNGCHVMLGCYRATRALMRRLGTEGDFQQDPSLVMSYRFAGGAPARLALSRLPVPVAMPWSVLGLGIGFGARLRALVGMASVVLGAPRAWTFADWLRRRWQRGAPDDVLWRPLCRAVMNCEPEEASAREFLATLREAFLGRASSAAFWIPKRPWGALLGEPAPAALADAGVELRTGARVAGLDVRGGRIAAIALANGDAVALEADDVVVSALPWWALASALPDGAPKPFEALRTAPIVTAYFECADDDGAPRDDGPVVAMAGGEPFHFLLRTPGDRRGRFALLSGGDRSFDGRGVDEIRAIAKAQLATFFPESSSSTVAEAVVRVRKEQRATFVPAPGTAAVRPAPGRLPGGPANLHVCGDWTATGFPATLEGAARSVEPMLRALEGAD